MELDEAEAFGRDGLGVDGGRGEEADGVAEAGVDGEGGKFRGKGVEEGPAAGTEHEGEGEGEDLAGVAVEGGGIIGEDLEAAVHESGGEGGFAGVGGGG